MNSTQEVILLLNHLSVRTWL